jgi:hypothetical protein
MRIPFFPAALIAIPLCTASAACAQPAPEEQGTVAEAQERMVPMTRPEQPGAITEMQAGEERAAITDWTQLAERPTREDVSRYAMSPPVVQDGTSITVMSAPEGFDSSAFVEMADSTGFYLIDNVREQDAAEERAKEIEAVLTGDLQLQKEITPTENASYAASLVPGRSGDLKLVNIIVAPDMLAGHTVTVAFTYQ